MSFIRVPPDSTGKKVDSKQMVDGADTVDRQVIVLAGGSGTAEVVVVTDAAPGAADMGVVVRQAGTLTVVGSVALTNNINISAMPAVTLSGTVEVTGVVNISSMPAVPVSIGAVAISGTAMVEVMNHVTIDLISATVTVAGAVTIGATVDVALAGKVTISGTATVAGSVGATVLNNIVISAMPAVTISGSAQIATGAVADFNTSADTTQNIPLIGIALSAAGGAVAWGGQVNISGTAVVSGAVTISGTATVAGSVGATVLNNLNISNTPSVVLAAGTANFGTLNDISRTVQVAIATPFIIQGISTTVTVAGNVNISTMPAVNISNTPTVLAVQRPMQALAVNSASRGPRTVLASTSSNVTLATAPGAGLAIFVTMVAASNASGTFTRGRFGTSQSVGAITQVMVQSGGGFVMQFDPPWELSANENLVCSVKPNASEGVFTAHFFVASSDAL